MAGSGTRTPLSPPLTITPVDPSPAAHVDRSSVFTLHSQPAAAMSIYLDFDGHVTTTTLFNTRGDSDPGNDIAKIVSTPFDRDGNPGSLSTAEVAEIEAVWQIVAEDYAPFNVDVTTEDPGEPGLRYSSARDSEYGVRIVISPD